MEEIFKYPNDAKEIKKIILSTRHIALIKVLLKYLAKNNDQDVPKIIFVLVNKKFTQGFRASLILLCEEYDCKRYFNFLIKLVINDTYNTALYANDIIVKYLSEIKFKNLNSAGKIIGKSIIVEKIKEKKQLQKQLLKTINEEIKIRLSAPSVHHNKNKE